MLRFNRIYFILTLLLFFTEVLIALYVHDKIIRPYIGDVLVVILIYCFVKSFLQANTYWLAGGVFLFACLIELLQYLQVVQKLGLMGNKVARIVIGTSFSWEDVFAYALGAIIIFAIERFFTAKKNPA